VRQDPSFKLADLTDADVATARQRWSADLDAMQTDLRPFLHRGGKLLHYHGWADSAVPPSMSVAYFAAVQQRIGSTADAYRLFMVPGMNHCAGGQGPWQTDWLAAMERWVERGQPPAELVMQNPANAQRQTLTPHAVR
jgi:feruloyl esterase